jgi:hypothetical protein
MTHHAHGESVYVHSLIISEKFYLSFITKNILLIATQYNRTWRILSKFCYYLFMLINNAANYIIVILDNSLVFRVTITDAVLIQFDLLRMSKILLETCTCRGSWYMYKKFVHEVGHCLSYPHWCIYHKCVCIPTQHDWHTHIHTYNHIFFFQSHQHVLRGNEILTYIYRWLTHQWVYFTLRLYVLIKRSSTVTRT